MYQITVSRIFSAAHAIRIYDGSFEPLHGHNWTVEVTVEASQLDAIEVVMDFHQLEKIVDELIEHVHNKNLNEIAPFGRGTDHGPSQGPSIFLFICCRIKCSCFRFAPQGRTG